MKTTLSIIKADVGSIGGHITPGHKLIDAVTQHIDSALDGGRAGKGRRRVPPHLMRLPMTTPDELLAKTRRTAEQALRMYTHWLRWHAGVGPRRQWLRPPE